MRQVPISALPLLSLALLMACGDDSMGPAPDTITVSGTVVDEYLNPQQRVGVFVTGHAIVTTDANGHFSIGGVKRPYDLAVGLLNERGALVYAGLTRNDPLVVVPRHRSVSLRFTC